MKEPNHSSPCAGSCRNCGSPGLIKYGGLRDRNYGVPGRWGHFFCPSCGLIWINPMPSPEDFSRLYRNYFTKEPLLGEELAERLFNAVALPVLQASMGYGRPNLRRRLTGRLLSLIPFFREAAVCYALGLDWRNGGSLLDVGCGNGKFISQMKALGWDVHGVELDPESSRFAREKKLDVKTGELKDLHFSDSSFDTVTLRHSLEHFNDPVGLLLECGRILKPGGRLAVITPNSGSLNHRLLKSLWYSLDPPRHFYLFNASSLRAAVEKAGKFEIVHLRTLSPHSGRRYVFSRMLEKRDGLMPMKVNEIIQVLLFTSFEYLYRIFKPSAGEDLLMVLKKK